MHSFWCRVGALLFSGFLPGVEASWELVGGSDAWGRQSLVLEQKTSQGSSWPAWRPSEKGVGGVSFGGSLSSEEGLPIILGGRSDASSQVYVQGAAGGQDYSLHLRLAYRLDDARNDDDFTLQHSHAAYRLGNWFVGAGKLDWFWGPGWDSAPLLQTPLEAPPTLFLQRAQLVVPDSAWLRWLGAWNWQMFAGQLERNRDHPDAKLLGARFTLQPLPGLEVGLARTAMWGGEGRPQSFSTLVNLLTGQGDNCESTVCRETEPGNQLAGVDLRYRWAWGKAQASIYAQMVGEDEASMLPSRNMHLAGLDWLHPHGAFDHPLTVFVELADTLSNGAVGRERPNYSYEHHIYRDGYRYQGYALGSSYDADSRTAVLGIIGQLDRDLLWQARLKYLDINRDGHDGRGRHTVSAGRALDTLGLELAAERFWRGAWLSFGLAVYDDKAYLAGSYIATTTGIRLLIP